MQVETIDDPTVRHLTLKNLDRHSHYRFYLRGRTGAGDGEPIMREGATTLEGGTNHVLCRLKYNSYMNRLYQIMNVILLFAWISVPPANIDLAVGENAVNFSWVAKKRHRNVSFQIHYLRKSGMILTLKCAQRRVSQSQTTKKEHAVFLQMGLNGRNQRRWTPLNLSTSSRAWHLALIIIYASHITTPPSGRLTLIQKEQVLWAFCLHSCFFLSSSLLSSGLPTSKYKARSYRECLAVPCAACEVLSKTCLKRELG